MSNPNARTKTDIKNIEVLFFAHFAEKTGQDSLQVQTAHQTVAQLFKMLHEQYSFAIDAAKTAVAINHHISDWQAVLSDGDIVAFIPPVAGG